MRPAISAPRLRCLTGLGRSRSRIAFHMYISGTAQESSDGESHGQLPRVSSHATHSERTKLVICSSMDCEAIGWSRRLRKPPLMAGCWPAARTDGVALVTGRKGYGPARIRTSLAANGPDPTSDQGRAEP